MDKQPKDILVKKQAWFIRFFLWCWGTKEDSLNQCTIFWGLLFFPIGFFANNSINAVGGWFLGWLGLLFYSSIASLIFGIQSFSIVFALCIILNSLVLCLIVVAGCIVGFGGIIELLKRKNNKAEKTLNSITALGSNAKHKIVKFLTIIFRPFKKNFLFIIKTFTKYISWDKFFFNDKETSFLKVMIGIMNFKDKHCRKIKLV